MAWIESHSSLRHHPKLIRLAASLKIDRIKAIGHLHCLWWWAMDYAENGDLSRFAPAEIAAGAEWLKDAERFVACLKDTGWLDATGGLHDWWEYAGKLVARRERKRDAMREARGSHVDTTGEPRGGLPTNQPTKPTKPTSPACADGEEPQGGLSDFERVYSACPGLVPAMIGPKKQKLLLELIGLAGIDLAITEINTASNKSDPIAYALQVVKNRITANQAKAQVEGESFVRSSIGQTKVNPI